MRHLYNARNHPAVIDVEREYKIRLDNGKVGYIDFVLTVEDTKYAIELKAGANSYRNSLQKAKDKGIDFVYGTDGHSGEASQSHNAILINANDLFPQDGHSEGDRTVRLSIPRNSQLHLALRLRCLARR